MSLIQRIRLWLGKMEWCLFKEWQVRPREHGKAQYCEAKNCYIYTCIPCICKLRDSRSDYYEEKGKKVG